MSWKASSFLLLPLLLVFCYLVLSVCWCRIGRPECIPLTTMVMRDNAAYLLDNGRILVLWLGRNIPLPFLKQVLSSRLMQQWLEGMHRSPRHRKTPFTCRKESSVAVEPFSCLFCFLPLQDVLTSVCGSGLPFQEVPAMIAGKLFFPFLISMCCRRCLSWSRCLPKTLFCPLSRCARAASCQSASMLW